MLNKKSGNVLTVYLFFLNPYLNLQKFAFLKKYTENHSNMFGNPVLWCCFLNFRQMVSVKIYIHAIKVEK